MIRLLLLCAALLAAPLSAQAQTEGDRNAIRGVIELQLEAFQRDDGARAFSYASPMIQGMFRTPEIFMDMVRRGYEPVYRPQRYEFQALDGSGANPVQDVFLIGPDGAPVIARYTMERQPDGSWRIHGCVLLDAPGLSV